MRAGSTSCYVHLVVLLAVAHPLLRHPLASARQLQQADGFAHLQDSSDSSAGAWGYRDSTMEVDTEFMLATLDQRLERMHRDPNDPAYRHVIRGAAHVHAVMQPLLVQAYHACRAGTPSWLWLDSHRQLQVLASESQPHFAAAASGCPLVDILLPPVARTATHCTTAAMLMWLLGARVVPALPAQQPCRSHRLAPADLPSNLLLSYFKQPKGSSKPLNLLLLPLEGLPVPPEATGSSGSTDTSTDSVQQAAAFKLADVLLCPDEVCQQQLQQEAQAGGIKGKVLLLPPLPPPEPRWWLPAGDTPPQRHQVLVTLPPGDAGKHAAQEVLQCWAHHLSNSSAPPFVLTLMGVPPHSQLPAELVTRLKAQATAQQEALQQQKQQQQQQEQEGQTGRRGLQSTKVSGADEDPDKKQQQKHAKKRHNHKQQHQKQHSKKHHPKKHTGKHKKQQHKKQQSQQQQLEVQQVQKQHGQHGKKQQPDSKHLQKHHSQHTKQRQQQSVQHHNNKHQRQHDNKHLQQQHSNKHHQQQHSHHQQKQSLLAKLGLPGVTGAANRARQLLSVAPSRTLQESGSSNSQQGAPTAAAESPLDALMVQLRALPAVEGSAWQQQWGGAWLRMVPGWHNISRRSGSDRCQQERHRRHSRQLQGDGACPLLQRSSQRLSEEQAAAAVHVCLPRAMYLHQDQQQQQQEKVQVVPGQVPAYIELEQCVLAALAAAALVVAPQQAAPARLQDHPAAVLFDGSGSPARAHEGPYRATRTLQQLLKQHQGVAAAARRLLEEAGDSQQSEQQQEEQGQDEQQQEQQQQEQEAAAAVAGTESSDAAALPGDAGLEEQELWQQLTQDVSVEKKGALHVRQLCQGLAAAAVLQMQPEQLQQRRLAARAEFLKQRSRAVRSVQQLMRLLLVHPAR